LMRSVPWFRERRRWYRAVGGWRGEEVEVGKYAGAGGTLSVVGDIMW
jgi:hypothetical protein